MAKIVTGPWTSQEDVYGPSINGGPREIWKSTSTKWYRQTKPYTMPLTYVKAIHSIESLTSNVPGVSVAYGQALCNDTKVGSLTDKILMSDSISSYNDAYKHFIAEIEPAKAELLALAAEREQSLKMIRERATQLTRIFQHLRRGQIGPALQIMGVAEKVPRRSERRRKKPSQKPYDLYLQYQFGWAPLVSDIHNAIQHFNAGLPAFRVTGKGKAGQHFSDQTGDLTVGLSKREMHVDSRHLIRARIHLQNQNVALAGSLGLLNPALALWEVTPWSFVFDYVVNVSEWLNGFTDLAGLDLRDASWTWKCKVHSEQSLAWNSGGTYYHATWVGNRFELHRDVGALPAPSLRIRDPWRMSAQRASTSVCLLLQQMRSIGR